MKASRLALAGLVAGVLLVGAAYASAWQQGGAPSWGIWSMIVGAALVMACMLALGALRSGVRTGRIVATSVFLFLVIVLGFGAPVLLPPETAASPLLFGLPLRAAIEIFGVGLVPLAVLPFVFAREFDARALDEASLAALTTECARLRAEGDRERERGG